MAKKIKILILSRTPWREDNSFGSSFSNIFGNIDEFEIANIYCGEGLPDTKVVKNFFQISEKMLVYNLLNKKHKVGKKVVLGKYLGDLEAQNFNVKEQKLFKYFKKNRFQIFLWARDLIWLLGRWKSKELNNFIDEYKPDMVFLPVYYWPYINKIGLYVKKRCDKKMVGYISDDNYTLKQYSLNPFFWLDRILKRRYVKKAIDKCEILYVISSLQKKEYDVYFKKNCKILYKGGAFSGVIPFKKTITNPVQLVYTGNIGDGRYITLSLIGKTLDLINSNKEKAVLQIYSQTPLNNKIKSSFLNIKSINFHGAISQNEVKAIQKSADVLIHVESFKLKEKLLVRHSFSTKIVDYFQAARCIFAIGWENAASINYLIKNNAAVVATNEEEIESELKKLISSPQKINEYAEKAWCCGKGNHEINEIQRGLIEDFNEIINNK